MRSRLSSQAGWLIGVLAVTGGCGCPPADSPRPVLHNDDRSLTQRAEELRRAADGALDKLDQYIDNKID